MKKTFLLLSLFPALAVAAPAERKLLKQIAAVNIYALDNAVFYCGKMAIDADGAYRAYHPDGKSGLDDLANGGQPGNWWALATDNGQPDGKPLIQGPDDPAPGFYVSMTTLEDTTRKASDPRRYVDAESINFFVLPGKDRFGARVADLGVIANLKTGRLVYAVFADHGPPGKIGEASIAAAKNLGIPSSARVGGADDGVVYLVFPKSNSQWPMTSAQIDTLGEQKFSDWGGLPRLKAALPELDWGRF